MEKPVKILPLTLRNEKHEVICNQAGFPIFGELQADGSIVYNMGGRDSITTVALTNELTGESQEINMPESTEIDWKEYNRIELEYYRPLTRLYINLELCFAIGIIIDSSYAPDPDLLVLFAFPFLLIRLEIRNLYPTFNYSRHFDWVRAAWGATR